MGRPEIRASAIVPGPALVMMQSHAPIHSWILLTKPVALTGMPPGGGEVLSLSNKRLLRPQTTTTCAVGPSSWPSFDTVASSAPMPSPPPTNKMAGRPGSSPRRLRMARRFGKPRENSGLIGRPLWMSCSSTRPFCLARCAQSSVGTKQRVTLVLNHVLWHVVKSVTTVEKLMGFIAPLCTLCLSTPRGTCCIKGCTDTTESGWYLSKARCIPERMKTPTNARYGTWNHLGWVIW
mmetsp:Transcript_23950/g.65728  ORF Transcript_23950/g.65728 Transcript_23950/m.65728 type:complete len:235 (-) Transcript_23950:655-1359(-)